MNRTGRRHRFASLGIALAIALCLLGGAGTARAADVCQWKGLDQGVWSQAGNWMNCHGGTSGPQTGDTVSFVNGVGGAVSVDDYDVSLTDITASGLGNGADWQIQGTGTHAITLTRNIVVSEAGGLGALHISLPIILDADVAVQTVQIMGNCTFSLSGTVNLNGHLLTLTIDNNGAVVGLNGSFTGPTAGGLKINAAPTAQLNIAGNAPSTYQGSTEINGGIVEISTANVPPSISHPFGAGDGPAAVLTDVQLHLHPAMIMDKPLTLKGNSSVSFTIGGANPVVTFSGTLTTEAGRPLALDIRDGAQITLAGHLVTDQITKTGPGLLVLATPNGNADHWTSVTINDGTLRLGASGVIPDAARVTLATATCTFDLHGFDETIGSFADNGGQVQLGAGTLTLSGNQSSTFSASITGTGNLVKNGPEFLTLFGANTFTGTTTMNAGTLLLDNANAGSALVGPLVANGGRVSVMRNAFATTTPVTLNAPATMDLGATPTHMGSLAGSGNITLGAGTLTIGDNNLSTVYNGALASTVGPLVKTGTGTLTLGGNVQAPHLTIFAGAVIANGTLNTIGTGAVDLNGGTLAGKGTVGPIGGLAGLISPGGDATAGNGPGVLHAAAVGPTSGFTLAAQINGSQAGTGYDQLALTGNLTFGANSVLQVTLGFQPPKNATFTLVDLAPGKTITGTFVNLPEGATVAVGGRHFSITYRGGDGNDIVLTATDDPPVVTYYLSEGATGSFFDEDILIANPNDADAPVTLTFSKEDGSQVVDTRTVPAKSRMTVHVDQIAGLEAVTGLSAQVTSTNRLPLVVERSMFWDKTRYAGSTGSSVDAPTADWFFAEGSQGFFHTFVLINNPNATPTDVTFTFFRESQAPVVKTITVGATTRLTLDCGTVPEIVGASFGISVHATQPIMAERSVYFDGQNGLGGTESAGVTAPATHWFLAEGATGGFFTTFVLVSNPNNTPAHVTFQYLLPGGDTVTVPKTVGANARLTTNVQGEDARLHDTAVSTVVTSDVPVIAERSMYWAAVLREGHNSFGVTDAGLKWGLAEGRTGTPFNYHTYILLANPQTTAANVTATFLREGAAPIVKTYTVAPTSRFNIDSADDELKELHDENFGVVIEVTNNVPITVERSMYWDANGVGFSGGTNATGIRLP